MPAGFRLELDGGAGGPWAGTCSGDQMGGMEPEAFHRIIEEPSLFGRRCIQFIQLLLKKRAEAFGGIDHGETGS